ncbi:GNAT family N-acetyltransferase [Sporolactobacillus terrae]|uniref:N-acetyltransferase domain-containing protein n=1 Tax=Sporolactobacillus terrae TaxID=269673 RepID=A0A5K7WWY8_9BACL|nr:GNAT family N-acetyltransferase [Sporolactobacillus terrae]BBN98194.1 hypothetical protein St703_08990 [Sporolactobacillus terrae]
MNQNLQPLRHEDFDLFFQIMEQSFPSVEVRPRDHEYDLLNEAAFTLWARYDAANRFLEGFIAEWAFRDFLFIEHFAVAPKLRGKGIGGQMLKAYLRQADRPVLLEVEEPETELAERRIQFYRRNGFMLSSFGYVQPDLRRTGDRVRLRLMQYPQALSESEFQQRKAAIFHLVYKRVM